jgi:hypothetical protein
MSTYKHTDHNTGKVKTITENKKRLTFGEVRERNLRRNRDARLLKELKK